MAEHAGPADPPAGPAERVGGPPPLPAGSGRAGAPLPDARAPRNTDGLERYGRFHGSGPADPVYTVRRGDGQVIELSELLYRVVCAVDGVRGTEEVAACVSAACGRELRAPDVEFLIREKLRPLGVTVLPDDPSAVPADAPASDLLLVLKGRRTLLPPRAVRALIRPLVPLHAPLVVVAVLAGFLAADVWFFVAHGAASALVEILDRPGGLLAVLALVVCSLLFHELGHASACRYGGARPGRIGFGVYLLWPSFFTDVTDVYRCSRADRLRTDLGGVYFNLIFMLALFGAYAVTGQPFLLAAVYLGHYEVLEQLVPVVRLDGYYILADLAGVPDLFGQVGPVLRGLLRREPGALAHLAPRSRRLVALWVPASTALFALQIGYTLYSLPRILTNAVRAVIAQVTLLSGAVAGGDALAAGAGVLRLALLLLAPLATVYLLLRLANALRRRLRTAERARALFLAVTARAPRRRPQRRRPAAPRRPHPEHPGRTPVRADPRCGDRAHPGHPGGGPGPAGHDGRPAAWDAATEPR